MAKKAAAQKGRADLPVSQDTQQRIPTTKSKPSALVDMLPLNAKSKQKQASSVKNLEMQLAEFRFLTAALQDYHLALNLAEPEGNRRQALCLMHDCLEFLFYEILLAKDVDIYSTGQNTIGFDIALNECKKRGISLPLIGYIRTIQKKRGDAKHHGQMPDSKEFELITPAFRIIFSIISYETFGQVLPDELAKNVDPFHLSLYELYRRARGQNWDKALVLGLRALVHKRRAIYRASEDFTTHGLNADDLISVFEGTARLSATPEEKQGISIVAASLRHAAETGQAREAAEETGRLFSELDYISPTIFDLPSARRLTERLYQPKGLRVSGVWSGSTDDQVREILKGAPELVRSFGQPYYMEDEDRYWTWWEFVVFDGFRWHSFHLRDDFSIALEMNLSKEERKQGPDLTGIIVEEFGKAASKVKI